VNFISIFFSAVQRNQSRPLFASEDESTV